MSRTTAQRRAVRRAARTRCQAVDLAGFSLVGEQIIDLSARGLLVECSRQTRVGDEVQVSFLAPGQHDHAGNELWFDAEAVVARVVAGQRWSDAGLGAGLEFTYFEKSSRHELLLRLVGCPLPLPKFRAWDGVRACQLPKNPSVPRGLLVYTERMLRIWARSVTQIAMARGFASVPWLRDVSPAVTSGSPRFCMSEVAGRLVELSGSGASAVLTAATKLMLDAQRMQEPVAWVGTDESSFFPPDVAQSGVDLSGLVVVRIPAAEAKRPITSLLAVAAERLLRSGAFGLVLIDLSCPDPRSRREPALSQPLQSRLLGLAQRHQAAVLFMTEKAEESASLGSLISLRAHVGRTWLGRERFVCELRVRKDKRRGPIWSEREECRGPMGLR